MADLKLRHKPKKPERRTVWQSMGPFYEGTSLASIVADLTEKRVPLDRVFVGEEYGDVYARYLMDEPEEEYFRRIEQYKVRLASWDRWYAENGEAVEKVKQERHQQRVDRAAAKADAARRYFEGQLAKLEKKGKKS